MGRRRAHPLNRTGTDGIDHLDIAGQQRANPRDLVGDRDQLDLLEIGSAWLPVIGISAHDRSNARRELAAGVRPGTIGLPEIAATIFHDQEMRHGKHGGQIGIGPGQAQLQFERAGRPCAGELVRDRFHLRPGGRIAMAQQRKNDVFSVQRLPVVEMDTATQTDIPYDSVLRPHPFGEARLTAQMPIKLGETAIEHVMADIISAGATLSRIERVRCRGGGARDADAPANPRAIRNRTCPAGDEPGG